MDYFGSIKELVFKRKDKILTDSLSVATVFHKKHRNILRAIDNIRNEIRGLLKNEQTPQIRKLLNAIGFWDGTYTLKQNNQKYRNVYMNKRGFLNLVMTFNGKEAVYLKNLYFLAFDELEKNQKRLSTNSLADRNKSTILLEGYQAQHNYEIEHHNYYLEKRKNRKLTNRANYIDYAIGQSYLIPISVIAQNYGTSAQKMNMFLNEAGIIYKRGTIWYLYSPYKNQGLADYHEKVYQSGNANHLLKWTSKGKYFIYTLLKNRYKITPKMERGRDFSQRMTVDFGKKENDEKTF